jgi:hypothetical protein
VCYGTLSFCEPCEICGRRHPGAPAELCFERRAEAEASSLDTELARYLASREAQFFAWLAARS